MAFKKRMWESNCYNSFSNNSSEARKLSPREVRYCSKFSYLVAKCNWNPSPQNLTPALCSSFHTTDERNQRIC